MNGNYCTENKNTEIRVDQVWKFCGSNGYRHHILSAKLYIYIHLFATFTNVDQISDNIKKQKASQR